MTKTMNAHTEGKAMTSEIRDAVKHGALYVIALCGALTLATAGAHVIVAHHILTHVAR